MGKMIPKIRLSGQELNNALYLAVEFAQGDNRSGRLLKEFFPDGFRNVIIPGWWYCQIAREIVAKGCLRGKIYPTVPVKRLASIIGSYFWYALAIAESNSGSEAGCRRVLEGIVNNLGPLRLPLFKKLQKGSPRIIDSFNTDILDRLTSLFPSHNETEHACNADQLFQQIEADRGEGKEIDPQRYRTEIWALMGENRVIDAFQKLKQLTDRGVTPDRYSIWEIFNKLAEQKKIIDLIEYARWRSLHNYPLNVKDASILMKATREKKDHFVYRQTLEFVEEIDLTPDSILILEILCAYLELNRHKDAQKLFDDVKNGAIPLDEHHYNVMINISAQQGDPVKAKLYFEQAKKIAPQDVAIYGSLIHAYGKSGDTKSAQQTFDEMEKNGMTPNAAQYGALIHAYGRSGYAELAHEVFYKMIDKGLTPGVVEYGALIYSYGKSGYAELAQRKFDEMIEKGFMPNSALYGALIYSYGKSNNAESAQQTFDRMIKNGLTPSASLYGALIDAYGRSGYAKLAQQKFDEMIDKGLTPGTVEYGALIHAYGKSGYTGLAQRTLGEMIEKGLTPGVVEYGALIDAYGKSDDSKSAQQTFDRMIKSGVAPDSALYGALIHAYVRSGYPDIGEETFRNMPEEIAISDEERIRFYNLIIRGYVQAGLIKDVHRMREERSKL
ncbi:MAG: hypothetical protein B6244_10650 [Candidatus Cloacimonetes bacterium 4572_55]|nr:MAG: hypothetical protein B6244_10650 [Candidatus Cloacimonetes bacterium 4572_55]